MRVRVINHNPEIPSHKLSTFDLGLSTVFLSTFNFELLTVIGTLSRGRGCGGAGVRSLSVNRRAGHRVFH